MIKRAFPAVNEKHLMAAAPLVYAVTILAMYFRGSRNWVDRFAQAHWLITYESGFIKRGLVGSLARIEMWSAALAISSADIIFFIAHIILIVWYFCIWWLCCRTARFKGAMFTIIPLVLTSPMVFVTTQKTGYFDQIIFLLMMGMAVLFVKNITRWVVPLFIIGILAHENMAIFYFPMLAYIGLIYFLLHGYRDLFRNKTAFLLLVLAVPLAVMVLVFMAQSFWFSGAESASYIYRLAERNKDIFTQGGDSLARTFSTPLTEWFGYESPRFFSRLLNPYGLITGVLPLLLVSAVIYEGLRRTQAKAMLFSLVGFFIMLVPILLFTLAWDEDRIWSYPLFLGLLCVWLLVESGVTLDYHEDHTILRLLSGCSTISLLFVAAPYWSDNLDMITRFILFAPVLLWLAGYIISTTLKIKNV